MKIQLASDLHLEFLEHSFPGERVIGPMPEADLIVLAGDIANGANAAHMFSDWQMPKGRQIIFVAGNHEYYGHTYGPTCQKISDVCALNNIHFLENNSVVIQGVRFLGCTLWTDYKLRSMYSQEQLMRNAESHLNDHRLIRTGRFVFTAKDALEMHEESRAWLKDELLKPFDGKTVVVTHHGPHPLSVHPRYVGDPLSAAFVSDVADLMPSVDLWLHGHVHDSCDYKVGRCRVVANPAGYVLNRRSAKDRSEFVFENKMFDPNLLITL